MGGGGRPEPPSSLDSVKVCKVHSLSSGKVAIAIFAFYSLNYSLTARLQNNSRPKSSTKVETKKKLQQFTVSGWLIINGERVIVKNENFKAEITFNMKCLYNYQLLFALIIIFIGY